MSSTHNALIALIAFALLALVRTRQDEGEIVYLRVTPGYGLR